MNARNWLVVLFLLSVGINVGMLFSRWLPADEVADGVGAVEVEPGGEEPGEWAERLVDRIAERLRLDDDVRAPFVERHSALLRQMVEGRQGARRAEEGLRRELTSSSPDTERIDRLLEELSTSRARTEEAFVHALLDGRKVLEPRQQVHFFRALRRLRGAEPPRAAGRPPGPGRPLDRGFAPGGGPQGAGRQGPRPEIRGPRTGGPPEPLEESASEGSGDR